MSDAYDRVAEVMGEEICKAFKSMLTKLSQADVNALSGDANITSNDLEEFFADLGECQMSIKFLKIHNNELQPTAAVTTMSNVCGSKSIECIPYKKN